MSIASNISDMFSIFRHRNYRVYACGNSISLVGLWMQRIATGWLAWELTGSGGWLGAIVFADLFPTVIFGPIGGALADRYSRLRILTIGQYLMMAQAVVLSLLVITGNMTIWLLLWLSIFQGIVASFNQPARTSLVPSLVPRDDLAQVVATNSIIFNLARFIGPAAAGMTIVTLGVAAAFAANAVSYLIFIVALSRIQTEPRPPSTRIRKSLMSELSEGFRYTASHNGIATILILLIASGLGARPIVELLPGFAAKHFNSGADGLAILSSSIGVGAVIGGVWLSAKGKSVSFAAVAFFNTLLMAIVVSVFSMTGSFWSGVPILLVAGFTMATSGIATQIFIQLNVDSDMRGRVLSFYGLIFRGAPATGTLLMGFASDYVGLSAPFWTGAALIVIVSIWVGGRLKNTSDQH